jgi:hypothetical protein
MIRAPKRAFLLLSNVPRFAIIPQRDPSAPAAKQRRKAEPQAAGAAKIICYSITSDVRGLNRRQRWMGVLNSCGRCATGNRRRVKRDVDYDETVLLGNGALFSGAPAATGAPLRLLAPRLSQGARHGDML